MAQNNYELKQSTILEMENEVLRAHIADLKIELKVKDEIIKMYRTLTDEVVTEVNNIIKVL